ncbi:thermonuclease family protein [Hymenobacter weizhouensis]|uniref:thermonuclease family protein n=1 Tax=Hymenobacter sp. YIM 151500-1 TaxID=2987689 RepID=UPI002226E7F7|nr:thermonuclease family protein [Hymenobacter sp. YIM 151500-1]UYZ64850.1 thermonuclease family protein [Hymenobacter sp. YIM 151500-1]
MSVPPKPVAAARRGTGPEYGAVRRVLDGDTYEVLLPAGLVRVRLLGVDAPELGQPFGQQAADSVARLLRGRLLEVNRGAADVYGRTLAGLRVAVEGGTGRKWLRVDSSAVVRGWAWAYEPGHTTPRWALLQQLAQLRHWGLWKCGNAAPVRPAVWRAYTKQEKLACWGGCSW